MNSRHPRAHARRYRPEPPERTYALGLLLLLVAATLQPGALLGCCSHDPGSTEPRGYCCCVMEGCNEEGEVRSCCEVEETAVATTSSTTNAPETASGTAPGAGPTMNRGRHCGCPSLFPATTAEFWIAPGSSETVDGSPLDCIARGAQVSRQTLAPPSPGASGSLGRARSSPHALLVPEDTGGTSVANRLAVKGVVGLLAFLGIARV
jgi:hypothetical protein